MPHDRLPNRDPRTIARDIPGVLDVLFPRLSGGLVKNLNGKAFRFEGIAPIPDALVAGASIQNSMLFEISTARAVSVLRGGGAASWEDCLQIASELQRRHFDAQIPAQLDDGDIAVADQAAHNLIVMLQSVQAQYPDTILEYAPTIPGLGWVASGNGDFALGTTLIEVKHTERSFNAGDFRQVLMYWLLRYAKMIEGDGASWNSVLLLNPRRNAALSLNFNDLARAASSSLHVIDLIELLRHAVSPELERR